MKNMNHESQELMILSIVGLLATIIALHREHPRSLLLLVLTLFMLAISFIARYRQHRQIKTYEARLRRKK